VKAPRYPGEALRSARQVLKWIWLMIGFGTLLPICQQSALNLGDRFVLCRS